MPPLGGRDESRPYAALARSLSRLIARLKRKMTQAHNTNTSAAPAAIAQPKTRPTQSSSLRRRNGAAATPHQSAGRRTNSLLKLSPSCQQRSHRGTFLKIPKGLLTPCCRGTSRWAQTWQPRPGSLILIFPLLRAPNKTLVGVGWGPLCTPKTERKAVPYLVSMNVAQGFSPACGAVALFRPAIGQA